MTNKTLVIPRCASGLPVELTLEERASALQKSVALSFKKEASTKNFIAKVGLEYQSWIIEQYGNDAVIACDEASGDVAKTLFYSLPDNQAWYDFNNAIKLEVVENKDTKKKGIPVGTFTSRLSRWIKSAGNTARLSAYKASESASLLEDERIIEEKMEKAKSGKEIRKLKTSLGEVSDKISKVEELTEIPPTPLTVTEVKEFVQKGISRLVKFINGQDASDEEIQMYRDTLIRLGVQFNFEVTKESDK